MADKMAKDDAEVLAGQTKVVHQIPIAQFRSVNYILTFFNVSEIKTRSLQLTVIKESDIKWQTFGKLGKSLDIDISPSENAGNLDLSITNNEIFNIQVELAFATLGET